MMRKIPQNKISLMKSFGWSEEEENSFKKYNSDILKDSKGTFQIQIRSTDKWYWFFKLSSGKNRLQYLCKCFNGSDGVHETSFDEACLVLKKKIKLSFKGIRIENTPLSNYIDEYIDFLSKRGGLINQKRTKKGIQYDVWVKNDDNIVSIENPITIRNKIRSINEFKIYCLKHKISVGDVSSKKMKHIFKDYSQELKNRGKRKFNGNIINNNNSTENSLKTSSIKLFLQNTRYFLDWLVIDKDEYGRGLLKQHPITLEYQNSIIKNEIGKQQPRFDFLDFKIDNYDKCIQDTIEFIRKSWITYCENDGDIEKLREQWLSYTKPTKSCGIVGTKHKNQSKDFVIMSDITYFISFLQLRYGFRIGEILNSYRDKESWDIYGDKKFQSSYFRKVKEKDTEYYVLEIRNSKNKNRSVPIEESIWSFNNAPPHNLGKKIEFETHKQKKGYRWETNIIDVIFTLFPKSPLTFPSPNLKAKENKGYSKTYYLNLFKEKMVNSVKPDGVGWFERDIHTTHHLRSYFINYMLRKDGVQPMDVCEITGHSINTMFNYYKRVSEESKRNTLQKSNLRDILKNK